MEGFSLFQLRLIDDKDEAEAIATMCINCKKYAGLNLRNSTFRRNDH